MLTTMHSNDAVLLNDDICCNNAFVVLYIIMCYSAAYWPCM